MIFNGLRIRYQAWSGVRQVGTEYALHCSADHLQADPRIGAAARLLVIARTNVVVGEAAINSVADDLADIAESNNVGPEVIQAALVQSEWTLGQEWPFCPSEPV